MKKVIFTGENPGAVNALYPVINKIAQEKEIEPIALISNNKKNIFGRKFSGKDSPCDYIEVGEESINPEGLQEIIRKTNPSLAVTGNGMLREKLGLEHAIIYGARQSNKASMMVLDFWGNPEHLLQDPNHEWNIPNYITAIDKISEESLLDAGIPKETIFITGNPFFDSLPEKEKEFGKLKRDVLRKKWGAEKKYVITFFSQPLQKDGINKMGFDEKDSFKTLLDAIPQNNYKNTLVILKPHPREDKDIFKDFISRYNIEIIQDDSNTRETILAADLNTTPWSTTAYESLAMNKAVMTLQPNANEEAKKIPFIKYWCQSQIIPTARDIFSARKILERYQTNIDYQKEQEKSRMQFAPDGRGTQNVRNLIYQIVLNK